MNLGNIQYLLDNLDCEIGFSDHSLGDNMSVAAVSLGARIIEKHVTADKNGRGMDNAVSLLPDEFKSYCSSIRETEKALKVNFDQNNSIISTYRRSLHFSKNLAKGSIVKISDICTIRPEDGIKPVYLNDVIGKKLKDNVTKGAAIKWDLIE
jgi:sialic acid synthase SpsE